MSRASGPIGQIPILVPRSVCPLGVGIWIYFCEKAEELGWNRASIRTLDGDLGKSGTQTAGREDFKTLGIVHK
ncbi:MAG TPA: hypothetical protein VIX37_15260 [Candidatus Sulfotelmatobacter sp.]